MFITHAYKFVIVVMFFTDWDVYSIFKFGYVTQKINQTLHTVGM